MTEHRSAGTNHATIEMPLRGLAGEDAERLVREARERVPGIVSVDVRVDAFRVRVTYDAAPGVREAIDAAIHALGVGTPHPHGAGTSRPE